MVRVTEENRTRRVFRQSAAVGLWGIRLAVPVPFSPDAEATAAFQLPGTPSPVQVRVALTLLSDAEEREHVMRNQSGDPVPDGLRFLTPDTAVREAVMHYVQSQLDLPVNFVAGSS